MGVPTGPSERSLVEASYTAIQPQTQILPPSVRSFEKSFSSPAILSVTRLHLVLLLTHYVQVSFIPGLEMLPFSRSHLT